jgi:hypothetical protein
VIFISRNFRYFLLGILFITICIPVFEEIAQIICTALEWVKGLIMVPITKLNCTIKKLTDEETPTKSFAIGFAAPYDEEEDDTDEDL